MQTFKNLLKSLLPDGVISFYHLFVAEFAALYFGYPSHRMLVIGVTGTKGKSSVTEMVSAILEEAKYRTALVNSIRFKIGEESRPNETRMSMPGRFFLQRFMYRAYRDECDAVIIEMTSEGARQSRHRGIALDCLIFTNLAPEHIESHGSLQAYKDAKYEIGEALAHSGKRERYMVANAEDPESARYLALPVEHVLPFSLDAAEPHEATPRGGYFTLDGARIETMLPGAFSLRNALAAATFARALGIKSATIASALKRLTRIPGRGERVEAGQDFDVVVDYAHTPDSLKAIYEAYDGVRRICVLGATGGGRDKWKRPVMAAVADQYCDEVILTDEDPYDDDPRAIVDDLARGFKKHTPEIVMDRRAAIARGIALARTGDSVIITGKGTDPNIARAAGAKEPWSDSRVAREEIEKLRRI
jgi:UDP-N-acetylmuramoyl-L-alanyl-D-glutamate--2,6-diaminopimelate ligase